jgi:hypothetical protein
MLNDQPCDIETYNTLKTTFSRFALLSRQVLREENNLIISYQYEHDITISLAVLSQPMEISFSMARTDNQKVMGKLNFSRINAAEKRNTVWTLFFDCNGDTRYSLNGACNTYNINDKDGIRMIFVHMLVLFVKKNQLAYPGD